MSAEKESKRHLIIFSVEQAIERMYSAVIESRSASDMCTMQGRAAMQRFSAQAPRANWIGGTFDQKKSPKKILSKKITA